jgi:hypothetical protein
LALESFKVRKMGVKKCNTARNGYGCLLEVERLTELVLEEAIREKLGFNVKSETQHN